MTGGSVNISVRSPSGEKVNLTNTSTNVDVKIFPKIKKGIKYGKKIVLYDCIINGYECTPLTVNAISSTYSGSVGEVLYLEISHQKSTDGTRETTTLVIGSLGYMRVSANLT